MGNLAVLIGRNIRAERVRSGMTQAQLGERLGQWGTSQISKIELGSRPIYAHELPMVCRALDCTLLELLRGADEADLRAIGLR